MSGPPGALAYEVTNDFDATVITVDAADLISGCAPHGQTSTTVLTMTCQGANLPALAQATVPRGA